MRDDQYLSSVLDDLEMQAEGLRLGERAEEVDELSVAEYAEVDLEARLHGSIGAELRLELVDAVALRGRLLRVGPGWLLVGTGLGAAVVPRAAVVAVHGLGEEAVAPGARALTSRLSLASVLRGVAETRSDCVLRLVGGGRYEGALGRVGTDFLELHAPVGRVVVPFSGICVLQERS